jgi:hypothetical protein
VCWSVKRSKLRSKQNLYNPDGVGLDALSGRSTRSGPVFPAESEIDGKKRFGEVERLRLLARFFGTLPEPHAGTALECLLL